MFRHLTIVLRTPTNKNYCVSKTLWKGIAPPLGSSLKL